MQTATHVSRTSRVPHRPSSTSSWVARLAAVTAFLAALLVSDRAAAQATYWQVPTGEVHALGDSFVQQQTTWSNMLDLSAQAVTGLGHHFEVGVSVYNVDFERSRGVVSLAENHDDRSQPFSPLALFTLQKRFELDEPVAFAIGTQTGVNPNRWGNMRVATRSYANVLLKLGERSSCAFGGYVANGIFLGRGTQVGPWGGCDVEMVERVLTFMADIDGGDHANAGISLGPKLEIGSHFGVAAGARAPNPWASESSWGAILQLEYRSAE